jgi:hypothetical protein
MRQAWLEKSLTKLNQTDIIFLDPDNGVNLDISKKGKINSIKYVFPDEIEAYYMLGKSIIIYNHRDRRPHEEYEKKILINRKYVALKSDVKVLRFKRISVRDYIFVIQAQHRDLVDRTIAYLTKPPCNFLFEKYRFKVKKK